MVAALLAAVAARAPGLTIVEAPSIRKADRPPECQPAYW
jgi:hypothetical protein